MSSVDYSTVSSRFCKCSLQQMFFQVWAEEERLCLQTSGFRNNGGENLQPSGTCILLKGISLVCNFPGFIFLTVESSSQCLNYCE